VGYGAADEKNRRGGPLGCVTAAGPWVADEKNRWHVAAACDDDWIFGGLIGKKTVKSKYFQRPNEKTVESSLSFNGLKNRQK
jgi:hypothetical protein